MKTNVQPSQDRSGQWINDLDLQATKANGANTDTRSRMQPLRRFVVVAGLLLCAFGAVALWRGMNPALSNEQVIARQLEAMRNGIEKRSAGSITQYISSDCTWNGMDAKSLRAAIAQSLLQWRDVRLDFDDSGTVVTGDEAASTGRYILTVRETKDAKPETYRGTFGLHWKKRNGNWYVTQASGGEQLPGVGNATDPSM
ncbi:MAG TPA: nuclear transport factor 2 family protein [Abditibacteriaceae bacterium]|jgi:hypothetical protein